MLDGDVTAPGSKNNIIIISNIMRRQFRKLYEENIRQPASIGTEKHKAYMCATVCNTKYKMKHIVCIVADVERMNIPAGRKLY